MKKIRVMLVDDSIVIRRLVSDILTADPEIEVVGTASDGVTALEKLPKLHPDLVLLDVEMPRMNGLETLAAVRRLNPRLPIIMFSTLTDRGARTTLEALSLGASDYVTKPANVGSVTAGQEQVRTELIPKIKSLCGRGTIFGGAVGAGRAATAPPVPVRPERANRSTVQVLVVGVSTGGPNALAAFLPGLPANFPVPICIVQHMPPLFTRLLAERLTAQGGLPVREAAGNEILRPGEVWLAPGDFHLSLVRRGEQVQVQLNQGPMENSCRPAVDVLFRSAVACYRAGVLGLVLTGMGQDGLRGCQEIHAAGGQIVVQDEATSVVWGMPGAVARAGLPDAVLPLPALADEIRRRAGGGLRAVPATGSNLKR